MLMHPIDEEILINKWQPIGEDWETNSNELISYRYSIRIRNMP